MNGLAAMIEGGLKWLGSYKDGFIVIGGTLTGLGALVAWLIANIRMKSRAKGPKVGTEPLNDSSNTAVRTLDQLTSTIATLSPSQRSILGIIAKHKDGIYILHIAGVVSMDRQTIYYRAKDLEAKGLITIEHLTDYNLSLSAELEKFLKVYPHALDSV
jgi:hypothetical protein